MQTTTKMILAICCIGAVAVETLTPVYAQHRHRCPQGWTVQGGRCAPYRWGGGPYWGGGWNNNWGGGWGRHRATLVRWASLSKAVDVSRIGGAGNRQAS